MNLAGQLRPIVAALAVLVAAVSTARAEDDRRATNVTLTAAGRRTVDAVVGRRRRLIGLALGRSQGGPSERAVGLLHELAGQLGDYG